MAPPHHHNLPPPRASFKDKKAKILAALATPAESYTDKSPKGSIDAAIVDLIDEINSIEGLVTTSSCSGRVAVFVEGPTRDGSGSEDGDDDGDAEGVLTGSPAGKGGGRWLYVSHDPVVIPKSVTTGFYARLCGLSPPAPPQSLPSSTPAASSPPRLIRLSFAPLILHIHCATLRHAKPLLAAAINAGFRESGVQSLRALDDADAGVTLGIRTAGLGFETVIGTVGRRPHAEDGIVDDDNDDGETCYGCVVGEEYLAAMFRVINERFEWNGRRKERLRLEIRRAFGIDRDQKTDWEDKDVRRARKREEGLKRQRMRQDRDRSGEPELHDGESGGEEGISQAMKKVGESILDTDGEVEDTVVALDGIFDRRKDLDPFIENA